MKNNNLKYQEYIRYVDEEWKEGNINELEEGGWISTKDRLPENNNDYLIIHRKFNRPETDIIEVFSYENNEWWDDGYKFKTNPDYRTVVYWMPLPEKPKE